MNTREQFGHYLLLKKLAEDPLGETFRAGKLGKQGMDQVVLLRVFNGPGIDAATFNRQLADRRRVHEVLRSPNVGTGVDLGEVRGVPYVAWDYISGKDLAALLQQAERRHSPIPSDHALLISERIALALAVGYETRLSDARLLHGCVVPHLVVLSNEGETRLLGFEAAPALRSVAVGTPQLATYLAPEARAGQPVHKSDDVYSLGAILLELLTGQAVPASDDLHGVIDQAVIANEGTPISEELKALLKRSLAPREQRVADVVAWHKALSKLMFEGQYNPTTFNLAFFMHNLFREDIERESQEIAVEKTMEIPVQASAAAAEAPPRAPAADSTSDAGSPAVREDTLAVRERYGLSEEANSSKNKVMIGIAATVAAIVLAAILYFVMRGQTPDGAQQAAIPAATPVPTPAGPTPDEIETQIQTLVDERAKQLEEGLLKQYDESLQGLKRQLQDAQKQAAERERQRLAAEEEAAQLAAAEAAAAAEAERLAAATPSPTPTPEPEAIAVVVPTPTPRATPTPAVQLPAPSAVRTGDLVSPGPGVTPPKKTKEPQAHFPEIARRMNRAATARDPVTVRIRVLVDENGDVIDVKQVGKEVGMGFDREALNVARGTKFDPATKDGVRVKMWVELPIQFRM